MQCLNIQIPLNCSSMLRMKEAGSSETTGHYDPTNHTPHPNSITDVLTYVIREAR
jgi:hypothetical protein